MYKNAGSWGIHPDLSSQIEDLRKLTSIHLKQLGQYAEKEPSSLTHAVRMLRYIQEISTERLNELLHFYAILKAGEWLAQHEGLPEQHMDSPDDVLIDFLFYRQRDRTEPTFALRTRGNRNRFIFAEVTIIKEPSYEADKYVELKAKNLSKMSGEKFYFVISGEMRKRVKEEIDKNHYDIQVVLLKDDLLVFGSA